MLLFQLLTLDQTQNTSVWVGDADEYFGVAVKKGNTVLAEKLDAALVELAADGTLKAISEKIFGTDLIAIK